MFPAQNNTVTAFPWGRAVGPSFDQLPPEIHLSIAEYLSHDDILELVRCSKGLNFLYTPCLYTSAAHITLEECMSQIRCPIQTNFTTRLLRNLITHATCVQLHKFLDIFEATSNRTDYGTPLVDLQSTTSIDPSTRIPLAILRSVLSPDVLRTDFIKALAKRLGPRMNEPGWSPINSILKTPSLITAGIADYLVEYGLDVNVFHDGFTTPLQAAIMENSVDLVKWLVRKGANVHVVDCFDWTPVNTVIGSLWQHVGREDVMEKKGEILSFLVEEAGANINGLPGRLQPFQQLNEQVRFWRRGFNNARTEVQKKGCRAVKYCLPLLLAYKANPDCFEPWTPEGGPLHWVADERIRFDRENRELFVRALVKLGAKVDLKDECGETALLKALNSPKPNVMDPVVKQLIRCKANIHQTDRHGESALAIVKRRKRQDILDVIEEVNPLALGMEDLSD